MDVQIDIVEPDIALFTTLSPSHIAGFGTVEAYYAEKHKLLRRKYKDTYAIGNADDRNQSGFDCQSHYTTTMRSPSDVSVENCVEYVDRSECEIVLGTHRYHIVTPIIGDYLMGSLAGAFLVAQRVGASEDEIIHSFATISLPDGRGNTLA